MKVVSVAEAKAQLSSLLNNAELGPVVVTRNGRAKAVILPIANDDDLERLLMAYSPKLQGILSVARQRIQEGAGIEHDDFWSEVESVKVKRPRSRRKSA